MLPRASSTPKPSHSHREHQQYPLKRDPKFTNPEEFSDVPQQWNFLKCAKSWLPGEGTLITHNNHRYLIGPVINMGINGHIHYCYKYPLPSIHKMNKNKNGKNNSSKPLVETLAAKIVPNRPEFEREVITHRGLVGCDHVTKLHDVLTSETSIISIIELAASDAYHFFVNHGYIKYGWKLQKIAIREWFAKLVMQNIVTGLHEMHTLKYIHCDVKLLNILVHIYSTETSKKNGGLYIFAKLTDFGHSLNCKESNGTMIASSLSSDGMTRTGTIGHVAPEVFKKGTRCDYKVDIWSLGIVLFSMLLPGHLLFGKYTSLKMLHQRYDEIINKMNPWSTNRPVWWTEFERLSPEARDLILWTTRWDPKERPSTKQILKHQWFLIGKTGHRQNYKPNLKYFDMLCSSSIAQE